jgi:hypothetical protein
MSTSLLNHFTDRFGIVTVVNATFYEIDGDRPLISFDTLKVSNISAEGEQKEIRGGQGAELLLQYDYGRTANVEITDALVSMDSLEYLFGGSQTTTPFSALRRIEGIVTTAGTIEEPDNWEDGTYNKVVITKANGSKVEKEGASAGEGPGFVWVDPTSSEAPTGAKYVLWYTAEYNGEGEPQTGKEMILRASDFPPTVRFVGETIVLDADAGKKVAMQIEIPKLKLDSSFTLTLDAEGDASVFDFGGVALSHNGQLLMIRTFDVAENEGE